jgi:predicted nucleotidyltransferase component of viral defense system
LEELLRQTDPRLYVLKGGVNLRFFFNSPRYSEDMDIDILAGNVATLKKNGYKILESSAFKRALSTFGIADIQINDPSKAKQTETTQRFRVRLVNEAGEQLPTKIEFSRRKGTDQPYVLQKISPEIAKPYHRLAYSCQHYTGESAALQKIQALAGRDLPQARDVFDLNILHSGGYLTASHVHKHLTKPLIQMALANLKTIHYDQFKGQVVEFLNESDRQIYGTESSWKLLKQTVSETLQHDT